MAAAAPYSRLAVVAGADHTTPLERPDEVSRALLALWGDRSDSVPL